MEDWKIFILNMVRIQYYSFKNMVYRFFSNGNLTTNKFEQDVLFKDECIIYKITL